MVFFVAEISGQKCVSVKNKVRTPKYGTRGPSCTLHTHDPLCPWVGVTTTFFRFSLLAPSRLQRNWVFKRIRRVALIRENQGCHAAAFINGVYGDGARYRFALANPQRNPMQMWRSGMRVSPSHFVTRSEERAALVLETLWPVRTIAPARRPHSKREPPRPLPAPNPSSKAPSELASPRAAAASATTGSAPKALLPDHYSAPTTSGEIQRGHRDADAPQA